MEYVEGRPLSEVMRERGQFTVGEVVKLLGPVAGALDHAHRQGVVHRDVKPGNIMVGEVGRVVLMDLGLAKAVEGGRVTQTGEVVGSPAYMAPEQVRGQGLGVWTDVYGLGVTVYEMLTLRRPFPGERGKGTTAERVLWEQLYIEPRPMREYNPRVPEQVEEVVRRALRKEPGERPEGVLEMLRGIGQGVKAEPLKGLEAGEVRERKGITRGVERWKRVWWYVGAAVGR